MATGASDSYLRVYQIKTQGSGSEEKVELVRAHEVKLDSEVNFVTYSTQGEYIIAGTNQALYVIAAIGFKMVSETKTHPTGVPSRSVFGFMDQEQKVLHTVQNNRSGNSYLVRRSITEGLPVTSSHQIDTNSITSASCNTCRTQIGLTNVNGDIAIYDIEKQKTINKINMHLMPAQACVFSQVEDLLYTGSVDQKIGFIQPVSRSSVAGYTPLIVIGVLLLAYLLQKLVS